MFQSPILDLVIVLSFMYFLLGLLVSTIHEFIYSVLSCKRGEFLKRSIDSLFFDQAWPVIAHSIFQTSHIQALRTDGNQNPSYIPARSFAAALMDQFRKEGELLDMNRIRVVLLQNSTNPPQIIRGKAREMLLSMFERAQGDLDLFQKQIESFYNDAMERGAGVYKRSTKKAILMISIVLATAINADTVHIARSLWLNPTGLSRAADKASADFKNINRQNGGAMPQNYSIDSSTITIVQRDTALIDSNATRAAKQTVQQVKSTVVYLQNSGIPIGWNAANIPHGDWSDIIWGWIFKLFGLLLTAVALMLGAPFWFDLLNKIVNLRAAGKKPDDNNTSSQASNPDPVTGKKAVG